ncbi:type III secretion system effector protein [Xanthomonas citri pv. anacardii]|uniref:XopX family type III secretion system effector n=1 Tax=Xanthomonas citri TaxID=346 RepID=UPI000CCC4642|nr:XopX family type III secretion system effector [Xanthomonas citri]MCT8355576.1 type III secretion system effector protein [Xanthomonas citri pv. anacardii]MCT8359451.1 type III secretion system effector protein [Xanthomonas citri pv. anacardii]MCT8365750.1 type III secretion system effector protein [Xanthomonas citri pv. anacardii]MCT8367528.1 type III secretion system effector protein [Xanthomonas citri pv. anacardii]MCT8371409.1 type III secretion system effector protein [Xanthomonas citr
MEIKQQQSAGPSSLVPLHDIHTDNAPVTDATSPAQTPMHPSLLALTPHNRSRASTADSEHDAPPVPSHDPEAQAHSPERAAGPSTAATLAARANAALASGVQQAYAAVSKGASDLWSLADLRTMLQIHADDPAFLQMVRHTDPEQHAPHSLAACRQQITQLRDVIEAATGLEARFRQQLLGDIKAVEDALQPLEHGTPAAGRALKSLANLVNLWPLVVPSPFLGNQAKTFAYSIAAATKGVMTLSASALRPTADGLPFPLMGGQLGRDANEMHLYAILLNGLFLTTELPKKFGNPSMRHQAEAVENNLGFAAAASTACAAMVVTPFLWNSLNVLGNRLQHKVSHLGAGIAESAGFQSQAQRLRARLTPGQISAQLRTQLNEICAALENGREAFQQARRAFTDPSQGHELTRTLNAQCTHLLETLDQCSKRLSTALQVDQNQNQDQPATIPRQVTNHDIAPKLALALLGAGVTGLTVYLIQPDRIGTVDLVADSILVTTVMMQSALNAHATRQDAMERFKAMCSGSLVMALALGVEKLSKTLADKSLIESSSASPYYAGAIMSLMSMTMPGPMARGAELAMNWGGAQVMRVFRGPDGTTLATRMPSSPEELIQNVEDTARYVQSLSPDQAQEYAQRVGEIALQVIEDAGAQAQTRPSSSVTITEIDDIADIEETNDDAALAAASASPEQRSPAHAHRSPDQAATSTAPSS